MINSTAQRGTALRYIKNFEYKYGQDLLKLAYHAALPVVINADLIHLLRINFFLDIPEPLPFTAEADLLLSSLCYDIGDSLYEIAPNIRNILLQRLVNEYPQERVREIATLLLQYNERYGPWVDRPELERAQQLTALNFLDPLKAKQWLEEAGKSLSPAPSVEREWFVAMWKEIEQISEISANASQFNLLVTGMGELKLPDLGEGMQEAEVIEWLVKEGDTIKLDQTIVKIETDTAIIEIPSPITGRISQIRVKSGQIAKVGDVLVVFEDSDAAEEFKFGELLRQFRKRASMAQQVLADKLGIDRRTISTWERGDYLPKTRETVLEFAGALSLDIEDTNALLQASLFSTMDAESYLAHLQTVAEAHKMLDATATYSTSDPLLAQAYRAYTQRNLDEAIKLYSRALQKDNKNPLAWQGYGLTQGSRLQHQDALTSFERALQLDPTLIASWNGKGTALSRLRRHQEALVSFERAIELDPNNAASWNGKGATLNALGRPAQALDAFEMALRLDPRLVQAWNNKGLVLNEMGRYSEAQKAFEESLDLDRNNAHALFGKGQALYAQRQLKEGLQYFDMALAVDDTFSEAWSRRGNVLDELGDYNAALNSYDRALRLNPRLATAWNGKGGVLRQLGQPFEALKAYNYALDIDPNYALAWNGKGNAHYVLGQFSEALIGYQRALQLNERLTTAWHNQALVLNRLGRYDEALRSANEAIRLSQNDPDHWLRKAEALKGLRRIEEAREAEEQAAFLRRST